MRKIKRIVLHTTAGWPHQKVSEIQVFWKNSLKWKSPGYHIIIPTDGNLVHLASIDKITNGVAGYNSDSLHVSYIGGLVEIKDGKYIYGDTRTQYQKDGFWSAIEYLFNELKKYQSIDDVTIVGHRDLSPDINGDGKIQEREWIKVCPTFDAIPEYGWICGNKALERLKHRKTY